MNYGKTFFVWICAVTFLLVLKDFVIYSKEEQYKKIGLRVTNQSAVYPGSIPF